MRLVPAVDMGAPRLGAIYGGMLVLCALAAWLWLSLGLPTPACPLHELTGLPCPTCGTTRLVTALLAGHPLEALAWNPLVFCAGLALVAWAMVSATGAVLGSSRSVLVLSARERMASRVGAVVILLAGWAWLVARQT